MKTQLEEIKPGESALVMCIDTQIRDEASQEKMLFKSLPILPYNFHTDIEIIRFPYKHYHFDFRFFPKELVTTFIEEDNKLIIDNPDEWTIVIQVADEVTCEPYLKELVCLREMPVFPTNYKFSSKLEKAYEYHPLVNNICPHKGYMTFKSTRDGCDRICPGHGLGLKNGKVCKRSKNLR